MMTICSVTISPLPALAVAIWLGGAALILYHITSFSRLKRPFIPSDLGFILVALTWPIWVLNYRIAAITAWVFRW